MEESQASGGMSTSLHEIGDKIEKKWGQAGQLLLQIGNMKESLFTSL